MHRILYTLTVCLFFLNLAHAQATTVEASISPQTEGNMPSAVDLMTPINPPMAPPPPPFRPPPPYPPPPPPPPFPPPPHRPPPPPLHYPPPPYYPPPSYSGLVNCWSRNRDYTECYVRGPIRRAGIEVLYSRSRCDYGYSWGYYGDRIWVDHGCRARFWIDDRYY